MNDIHPKNNECNVDGNHKEHFPHEGSRAEDGISVLRQRPKNYARECRQKEAAQQPVAGPGHDPAWGEYGIIKRDNPVPPVQGPTQRPCQILGRPRVSKSAQIDSDSLWAALKKYRHNKSEEREHRGSSDVE